MDGVEGRKHEDRGAPKEERHSCIGDRMRREIQCGVVARIGQQSNGGLAACGEGRRGLETSPGEKDLARLLFARVEDEFALRRSRKDDLHRAGSKRKATTIKRIKDGKDPQ